MEAQNADEFGTVYMNDAEIKWVYTAAMHDDAGLLPSNEDSLESGLNALESAHGGDGRISLRQSEMREVYRAAKRADLNVLPTAEESLNAALDKLEAAYEN